MKGITARAGTFLFASLLSLHNSRCHCSHPPLATFIGDLFFWPPVSLPPATPPLPCCLPALKLSPLSRRHPCSLFLSFLPSLTLVTPKYSCHLSVSSPSMLLSTLKSCSISLSPPSYSCKAAETSGCPFASCFASSQWPPPPPVNLPVTRPTYLPSSYQSFFFFHLSPLLKSIDQCVLTYLIKTHTHTLTHTHLSVCVTYFNRNLSIAKNTRPPSPVNSARWSVYFTCSVFKNDYN